MPSGLVHHEDGVGTLCDLELIFSPSWESPS
jgi:hypothetical protein